MPKPVTMPEGVIKPAERVYKTPRGKYIKNKSKGEGVKEGFKILRLSATEVDAAGVDILLPEGVVVPERVTSVNMAAIPAKTAVMVIEDENEPTEMVFKGVTKPLKTGCVWLVPSSEVAKIWFQGTWHHLGDYGPADTARVKLQIDATKEIGHLRCAIEAENFLIATNYDWES